MFDFIERRLIFRPISPAQSWTEPPPDAVEVREFKKRPPLARLRALAVGDVQEGKLAVLLARDPCRHARVHPTGDEADG